MLYIAHISVQAVDMNDRDMDNIIAFESSSREAAFVRARSIAKDAVDRSGYSDQLFTVTLSIVEMPSAIEDCKIHHLLSVDDSDEFYDIKK